MRKIKMRTYGPDGKYLPGQTLDMEDAQASIFVKQGHAVYIDGAPPPAAVPKKTKRGRKAVK